MRGYRIETLEVRRLLADLFASGKTLNAGGTVTDVALADLNVDGKLDLVSANSGTHDVSVILGKGDGTFQTQVRYPTGGSQPVAVAVADLNGDGLPDLATAHNAYSDYNGAVLFNSGNGTFSAPVLLNLLAPRTSVSAADFNEDGRIDLAFASQGGVSVLLNLGNASFSSPLTLSAGENYGTLLCTDLNADGHADVLMGTYLGTQSDGYVAVFLGSGQGTFASPVHIDMPGRPSDLAIADLNGDGRCDLVASASNRDSCFVFLQNATGEFPEPLAVNEYSNALAITDLTGDGVPDLVGCGGASLKLLRGNGDGSFAFLSQFVGGSSGGLVVADFQNDGVTDIVTTLGSSLKLFIGNNHGRDLAARYFRTGSVPRDICASDFNGDSVLDLATANGGSSNVAVLLGNGQGGFASAQFYPTGGEATVLSSADLNDDGAQDLIVTNYTGSLCVFLGTGDGTFSPAVSYGAIYGASSLSASDFNGDGKIDVAVATSQQIAILFGNGSGILQPAVRSNFPQTGKVDFIPNYRQTGRTGFALFSTSGIRFMESVGDGTFVSRTNVPAFCSFEQVRAVADLNNDGIADLVYNSSPLVVSVQLGRSDGSFAAARNFTSIPFSIAGRIADFDGDGFPDLAFGNQTQTTVAVMLGDGLGGLSPAQSYSAGSQPRSLAVGDFNRDGKADLAIASFGESFIGVLINQAPPRVRGLALLSEDMLGIQAQFSENVRDALSTADFEVLNLDTNQPVPTEQIILAYDADLNRATFAFTMLADGHYRATLRASGVSNAMGISMEADAVLNFEFLRGDLNRDRTVNFDDLLILAQNYGQSGKPYSQGNVDYSPDGLVSFDDLLILAQRYGTSLFSAAPIAKRSRSSRLDAVGLV